MFCSAAKVVKEVYDSYKVGSTALSHKKIEHVFACLHSERWLISRITILHRVNRKLCVSSIESLNALHEERLWHSVTISCRFHLRCALSKLMCQRCECSGPSERVVILY